MQGSGAVSSFSAQAVRASDQARRGLPGFRKGRGVSTLSPPRKTPHSGMKPTMLSGV